MFEFARNLFAPFCHQIPERCLCLGGAPFPLCARCAGLYAGCGLGGLWLAAAGGRLRLSLRGLGLSAALLALCAIDALARLSYTWGLGNGFRFLLGYGAGLAAVALTATLLRPWLAVPSVSRRQQVRSWPVLLPLLIAPALLFIPADGTAVVLLLLCLWGWACYQVLALLALAGLGRLFLTQVHRHTVGLGRE
jgi:uncharacterized membrane protein